MVHGCVMHVLENVYRGKLKPLVRSTIFRIRVKRVESKYRLSEVKNWSSEFHILSNLVFFVYCFLNINCDLEKWIKYIQKYYNI